MNETEIVQHPQIDGLRIFFDTVDYRTPHVHEEFELIWLMEGRLSVQAGPFRHVAQSGEMVLFDPQQTHEFHKVEESCTFLCLQVAPTMLAGCFPAIRNIRTGGVCPGIYLSPDVFAQVQRGLLNVMRAYLERPACYELCCAGHVHLLMYRLLAAAPHVLLTAEENAERERRNARLLRLIRFVDQNYMHKIRLSDFARAERRSMSYLSHFVKEALGQSFQEYVNMALSERRRAAIKAAYGEGLYECPVTVENELDARRAVEDVQAAGVNALVVFLGNFGPETPETLIAEWFSGPIMYAAAAEGDGDLHDGRGDAYCGMLNCSYNLGLRGKTAYIPEYPVGTAPELAEKVAEFVPIARAILGLRGLKLITFGPRPDDFLACNGPIKALYDLGVAVEENSELDLLVAYNKHADDPRIPAKMAEMQAELGGSNKYAGVLPRLAQYELTLLDWAEAHKGARQYVAFANKCWPAFQTEFKFVPCYVNSRLAAMGIPVSCEVDIYGALSEYIGVCVSGAPTTLLDINNTVPASIYDKAIRGRYDVRLPETFMGFHCGNTSCAMLKDPHMGYQLIMKRDLEPELPEPDITRGTMEGNIKPGDITFFRLQSTADTQLKAYVAQGQVLDVDCESFGSIGAFAIPEMDRFYRHVLIAKRYPHHGAVAFGHWGKALFEVFKYLGVTDIAYNQPRSLPYPGENPFV